MDAFGVFDRDGGIREEWHDAPSLHVDACGTRARAVAHEKRHERVLSGLNIKHNGHRVWRDGNYWAGQTYINRSNSNMRRWESLTPAQQAAVYMSGAMGPYGEADGCSSDLAAVDSLASRGAARAVARRYL